MPLTKASRPTSNRTWWPRTPFWDFAIVYWKKGAKMMKNGTSKQISTVRWFFILLVYCVLVGLLTESKMHFFWRGFLGIFFFLSVLKYYLAESLVKAKSFWLFAPSFFPRVFLFWINTLCMHASFFYYIKCIWKYVFVRKKYLLKVCKKKSSQSWKFMMASGCGFGYGKSRKMYLYLIS